MEDSRTGNDLQAGIAALKEGDWLTAKHHLQRVLDEDENNEMAWLWLSGAVDHPADRRLCLQNVLTLNPDSIAARDGLERLGPGPITPLSALHDDVATTSPAAAILYPERHLRRWRWRLAPEELAPPPSIQYQSHSDYADIWTQADEICGYCAAKVSFEERRCPACRRHLNYSRFRYPQPGADLYIYVTFILALTQFYLYYVVVDFAVAPWPARVSGIIIPLSLFVVVIGLLMRRLWAFPASFVALAVLAFAAFFAVEPNVLRNLQALPRFFYFIPPLVLVGAIATIFFGIFKITADFDHVRERHLARVDKGLHGGHAYYERGRLYATQGLWATAVLHWQRAAATDPGQVAYQRTLAQGYAHLGFYDRSLNMLQSARRLATHPNVVAELEALTRRVEQLQAEASDNSTTISTYSG